MQHQLRELATLNEIGIILNQATAFNDALEPALEKLVALVSLTTGWIFLTNVTMGDTHKGSFRLAAHTGLPPALSQQRCQPLCEGGCECQSLLSRGDLDQGVNMVTCSRLSYATGDKQGLSIHASIPLLAKDGPVGIINLTAPGDTHFDEQSLAFLTAVGRQIGTAYDRSKLQENQTQETRYFATLEERQRLATDMHDSVTQLLFAADLQAQVGQDLDSATQKDVALAQTSSLLQQALEELRALIDMNRPWELSGGLKAALGRLSKQMDARVKIHLELAPIPLDKTVEEALYRITQEALHNCLKHAKAQQIWITLREQSGKLSLSIKDDGQGFDVSETVQGLGLNSMKNRAEAIQAHLTISSEITQGSIVEVLL